MNQVSAHKIGLVFGGMLAIWHAIWALMVFVGLAKLFLDWILGLHFLNFQYNVNPFVFLKALMLVIVTGVFGYIMGYVCGWLWNLAHRTAHRQ
jgi:H+/Cl- antiporter ClcA